MKRRRVAAVLRFRAGSTPVAIAAAAVARVGVPEPEARHIAAILGIDRDPTGTPGRTIAIRIGTEEVRFTVDDPVEVDEIHRGELVSGSDEMSRFSHAAVIGFARKRGQLVMLLDLEQVVHASRCG